MARGGQTIGYQEHRKGRKARDYKKGMIGQKQEETKEQGKIMVLKSEQ